ncbi:hypothetical protein INT43_004733 [Umbelopsis isabellina]|uniref:Uncharacterized protein n=1 Tax=Mortierella isabellina TaxID=91625 RepID=A0A8H7PGS1_MORIS|nr:hypothetical protein INT43_004733 [Umbelopsis isabellina]
MLPGVSAQSTGPLAVAQTITTQLAQNEVDLGFGVLLSASQFKSPLNQVAKGPLAAVSSLSWAFDLLRVRQDAPLPARIYDCKRGVFSKTAKLMERNSNNSWLSTMTLVVSNWTLGFLGILNHLDSDGWSWWYVVGVIAFSIADDKVSC